MWVFLSILTVAFGGLALWLWPSKIDDEPTYTTLLATGDAVQISLVKSLLTEAGIPYIVKGERVQDLFGMGRLGSGYNFITGPAQIQVPAEYAAEAREFLEASQKEDIGPKEDALRQFDDAEEKDAE